MKIGKKYFQITSVERKEIALLLKKGYSQRDVARAIKRSSSSISDEIRRNSVNDGYDPFKAQHKARVRRQNSKYQGMKIVQRPTLQEFVEAGVKEGWSPELIAGRIKKIETHLPHASHLAIYKFIYSVYGRRLEPFLIRKGKAKRKNYPKNSGLTDRMFIDERPEIIENQGRYGDWEGDLIVSGKDGKGVLLVMYERKAGYILIKRLMTTSPDKINEAFRRLTGGILCLNSLTLDNDIAFRKHKELSEKLGVAVYFCHPYHSWEKGGVENANGLIRRYIKKGSDISLLEDSFIYEVQERLNNRPRKKLGFKTPNEIMRENHQLKYCLPMLESDYQNNLKTPSLVLGLRA